MKTAHAFPRSRRLLSAGDYRHVFEGAELRVSDKHFLILARPNQFSCPRIGLIVAKKNIKLAVGRNRVKRIVRESFRTHRANLPALDIVFLARRGLGELDNRMLQQRLDHSWSLLAKKCLKLHNKGRDAGRRPRRGTPPGNTPSAATSN